MIDFETILKEIVELYSFHYSFSHSVWNIFDSQKEIISKIFDINNNDYISNERYSYLI